MGHREQLLIGAKQCLMDKGFARTTARDIVAASGTNLASIGYHFGSKDNLMVEALVVAASEWAEEVERVLSETSEASPIKRLESMWGGLIASFRRQPGLWKASMEFFQASEERPEVRQMLAEAYVMARRGLASIFLGVAEEDVGDEVAGTVGGLLLATIPGLLAQWSLDPERAPGAAALANGMSRVSEMLRAPGIPPR